MSGLPHSPVKNERKERPGAGKFWDRILAVMSILHQYDWVWMLDLDTIIMTPATPLESFLDPRSDVIVGADCNGPNSGSTIYRNSTWTAMYLTEVYTRTPEETPNYDGWQARSCLPRGPARPGALLGCMSEVGCTECCWVPAAGERRRSPP